MHEDIHLGPAHPKHPDFSLNAAKEKFSKLEAELEHAFKAENKKPGEMVREFHRKFGMPVGEKVQWPSPEREDLRVRLIDEEVDEFKDEVDAKHLVNMVKEACDIMYVLHGMLIEAGVDSDAAFAEVHRSNMSKVWPDGEVKYREDGKVLKPPTYSPADIEKVLFKD